MARKTDFSFESIVNEVFEKWTCNKKRANAFLINTAIDTNSIDELESVKATNPFTGETRNMGANFSSNFSKLDSVDLCYINTGHDTFWPVHNLFSYICAGVIRHRFELFWDYKDDDDEGDFFREIIHSATYGKQFIELIESKKDEILEICLDRPDDGSGQYIPDDFFGNPLTYSDRYDPMSKDNWFITNVLFKKTDKDGNVLDHDYFKDSLDVVFNAEDYDGCFDEPFKPAVEALTAVIWKALKPQFYKYVDEFGAVSKDPNADLEFDDPIKYIKSKYSYYMELISLLISLEDDPHILEYDSEFDKKVDMLKEDCTTGTLDEALKYLKYWNAGTLRYIVEYMRENSQY